jgi:uncharacterized protein YpbB
MAAIAARRELKTSTVAAHLGELLQQGHDLDIDQYVDREVRAAMTELFKAHGLFRLRPIVEAMEGRAGYDEATVVRGFLVSRGGKSEGEGESDSGGLPTREPDISRH